MNIALDYDKTYNLDKPFWNSFISDTLFKGYKVYLVTARSKELDALTADQWGWPESAVPIIYCNGVAKRWCLQMHHGINIDIWIDDRPDNILNNSNATPEFLVEWRNSEEYSR
jgi:5'(3')-deoxyribonucleotidase